MSLKINKFTESDCNLLLLSYFKNNPCQLIDFCVNPISSDVNGYMGDHLLLKINVLISNKQLTLHFFLKTLYTKHEISSLFIMSGNMFNKEINGYKFFEKLKREFPNFDSDCVPEYHSSRENSYIVLEELYSSGYKLTKDMDSDHLGTVIRALAKFHAGSLIFEETKSKQLNRKYRLLEDYSETLQESLYQKDKHSLGYKFIRCSLNAVLALIEFLPEDKLSTKEFKEKVSQLAANLFDNFQPSKRFRNVWSHGNLWLKNVMFRYENGRPITCKLFDFQLQRYTPPAHDLCELLYEGVAKEDKQHLWDYYINMYYQFLTREVEKCGHQINSILTMEELQLSCNTALPYLILGKSFLITYYLIGPENYERIDSDDETYAKITFENRSEFLVDIYKSNEVYRKAVNDVLEDIRDQLNNDYLSSYDCHSILKSKLKTTRYKFLDYQILNSDKKCHSCKSNLSLNVKIEVDGGVKDLYFNVKLVFKEKHPQNNLNKEMKMHTTIFPYFVKNGIKEIKECLGKCYLSLQDKLLVFDDLKRNNYKISAFGLSYDYETVLCVIKKLAKFHASSIILEKSKGIELNAIFREEMEEAIYTESNKVTTTVEEIVKQISLIEKLNSGLKSRIIEAFSRLEKNVSPSETYRNVLCHGNLSPKNILINFEEDIAVDIIFVDFDSYRYNTPAHDLISFLYQTTDRKFRNMYFHKVLNIYYGEMCETLKLNEIFAENIFPREEFTLSCEAAKEFALTNCVVQLYKILSFQHATPNFGFIENDESSTNSKKCSLIQKMVECFKDFEELC